MGLDIDSHFSGFDFDTARDATTSAADVELDQLEAELRAALRGYRTAKNTFAAITAAYGRRHDDPITADLAARNNYDRQRAITDASWYQQEATVAALALIALRGGGVR